MKGKTYPVLTLILVALVIITVFTGCSSGGASATTSSAPVTGSNSNPSSSPSPATPAATTRQITNGDGSSLTLPVNVTRVACLYGPSYEKVTMLGAEDKIIMAYDQGSLWPWSQVIYKNLKNVTMVPGNTASTPNVEELMKNNIQVVFFWNTPEQIDKMKASGIASVFPSNSLQKLDDAKTFLKVYAEALGGSAINKANAYAAYFDEKKKMIADRIADIPDSSKPTVYYAVRKALQTGGKTSQLPEIVSLAGGKCVTADLDAGFGKDIVLEQLLQWNPQYIIIDHCGAANLGSAPTEKILSDISTDSRFKEIKAVQDNHVYMSPTGVFFWDSGEQMILQVLWLAKLIHPDKFQDVDMVKEVKTFYSTFFGYSLTDDEANRILRHELPAQ